MLDDGGFFFLFFLIIVIGIGFRVVRGILFVRNLARSQKDIEAIYRALQQEIANASASGGARKSGAVSHQAAAPQLATMFLQYRNQMAQLDQLHQARYEARLGELQSMAANAGLDWTP
jgi:hypothetical protein